MATIVYSVMGEGRGHAARARAMVERLRDQHRMVLYSSYDALEFLRREYAAVPDIEVRETEGLRFHYKDGRLDLAKTIGEGLGLWRNVRSVVRARAEELKELAPDLVVSDFEPTLARAAQRVGVPVLSLDHQHVLTTYDLSPLPVRLRSWAWAMSWSIWAFGIGQAKTVVSGFYKPPLRRGFEDVIQVGPLLRPAVRERTATRGAHLLSYLRRATPASVLDDLESLDMPVRVYGLGERPRRGGLEFRPISENGFLDDLASCDAVVAAAGNQLLGEALHLGKPVLALPEYNHFEQCINAWFLRQIGGGEWAYLEHATHADLASFIDRREGYRRRLAESPETFDGTDDAAQAIESMLPPR